MTPQHTPGPWAVYPPEFNADSCWSVQTDAGMSVVICGGDTPENHATACIIAAVPELLEALRVCEAALDAYSGGESDDLELARFAIAKAEGRDE